MFDNLRITGYPVHSLLHYVTAHALNLPHPTLLGP